MADRDLAPAATGTYSVLRPHDLVSLTVRSTGLRERVGAGGVTEWVAADGEGRLIVDLPPQHIAESFLGPGETSSQGRLAGPSSLHFAVPRNGIVALSTQGVLAAMNELKLVVAPRVQGQASTLELPWRLLLALHEQAECRHREEPVTGGDGATQMWHTRILGPSQSGYSGVHPFASLPLENPFADRTPLRNRVASIAQQGSVNPALAMSVDKLILTACGAWFTGSVNYPDLDWTHRTAMGRDFYVRLEVRGVLFPFGHQVSVVSVTERRFDTGTKVAGLNQTYALIVLQPSLDYGTEAAHEREFPFQRVEIEPLQIMPLDRPGDDSMFWPSRDGSPVLFTLRAWTPGDVVSMRMPLLFGDRTQTAQQLGERYAQGPGAGFAEAAGPPSAAVHRAIPLAVRKNADDVVTAVAGTVHEVQAVTFGANIVAGGAGFHPKLARLEVKLPALQQLLGQDVAAISATLSPELRSPGAGPPDELLRFDKQVINFGAAQAGPVAAPNMAVDCIQRKLGPTVANLPTNPADMFDASAKLLGVVPIKDIISAVTGPDRPEVTWSQDPPQATLGWRTAPTKAHGPFVPVTAPPARACAVELSVRTVTGGGPTTVKGTISNFAVAIPGPDNFLVRLDLAELCFHAETGKLPETKFTITDAKLGQKLKLIQRLSNCLPSVGNSAPEVAVTSRSVQIRYAIAVPTPLGLGLFTLQNLLLQAGITLSLDGQPMVLDFAFGLRSNPFLVTVMGLGGGGYLELGVRAGGEDSGLERFVGGIEFGASVAMNFGVAAGEVHVFGGVVLVKQGSSVEVTGYLRIGGSVKVLGLVSVSIELTISLTFVEPNILRGAAKLVIAIDLTFWSDSVEISCEKTFVGSPQTLADREAFVPDAGVGHSVDKALGPVGSSFPWRTYCQAYSGA